jgi:hypothetical protein
MAGHADTIHRLYTAFAQLDAETMAQCYAPTVQFSDPVFELSGQREVTSMWAMLCEATARRAKADWNLEYNQVSANDHEGRAHWDVHYRFSATGRLVLNRIDAHFHFNEDGLIIEHRDRFDFWTWSRQAFGVSGLLLGWTPFLKAKVRAQARANLDRFLAR